MTIFTRLLEKLYRVAAKYRRASIVVGAAALAPSLLGVSESARAQVCIPPPPTPGASGNASCTGTFNTTINYNTGTGSPINLTLSPGVIVNSPGGNAVSGFNVGGVPLPPTSAPIMITATGTVITGNPSSGNQAGLIVQSSGDAIINATNTSVNVAGTGPSDNAIFAITYGNSTVARVIYDAGATAGITSSGANSTGIQADNRGIGDVSIDASGNISGHLGTPSGFTFLGLDAVAGDTTGGGLGEPATRL